MILSDDILLTVLVLIRLNIENEEPLVIPNEARKQLRRKGWITLTRNPFDCDDLHITASGMMASDLFAPDLGVNPCPVEAP